MEETQTGGGSALKAMVSFFTIWQQDITQEDMDAMERRFSLVPIVGLLFAVVMIVAMVILMYINTHLGFGSGMFYAIAVLAIAWIGSKFIHFDGLVDFGDGMIVSGTQEDHVRALKDTLVGAGGVGVALCVVLFSFSLYSMVGLYLICLAPIVEILVKNSMVVAAAFGKAGNGMAGRQVSMTGTRSAMESTVISLVLIMILSLVTVAILNTTMVPMLSVKIGKVVLGSILGLVMSLIAGYLMATKANKVFGMVNGDILGATNEISRPLIMIVMTMIMCL